MNNVVSPLSIRRAAASIARSYEAKGAVVIAVYEDRTRIGVEGLTPQEVQDALCLAIHYNFCFDEEATASCPTSLD